MKKSSTFSSKKDFLDSFVIPKDDGRQEEPKSLNFDKVNFDSNLLLQQIEQQQSKESEEAYRKIVEKIIDFSKDYIDNQSKSKQTLRNKLCIFLAALLSVQFVFLIMALFFKGFDCVLFSLDDKIITCYIVSVFVETLAALGVIISFSVKTTEESSLIEILNSVVTNYQKYKTQDR